MKIHAQRGVKIGGLWYGKSDPAIEPYQGKLSAGDPLATLPVLFHLIWRRVLTADLSLVLSDRTVVRVAGLD